MTWRTNYQSTRFYRNIIKNPLIEYYEKIITLPEPASANCNYFYGSEAVIGMITKVKDNKEVRQVDATL